MVEKCPECGSINIFEDLKKGEVSCRDCGYVIDDKLIDLTKQDRYFDEPAKGEHSGIPIDPAIHNTGCYTDIGNSYELASKNSSKMYRLNRIQHRVSNAYSRNINTATSEIKRICSNLKLPQTVENESLRIYVKSVQHKLVKGRTIDIVVAASIYTSCRILNLPRTLDEVANSTCLSKRDIARTYKVLYHELDMNINPPNPIDYIHRFTSELGVSEKVKIKSVRLLEKAIASDQFSGICPAGLCAASIYLASIICGERCVQQEISRVAGITDITLRTRYLDFISKLGIKNELKNIKSPKKL